jgi:dihydroorotase-like cyclic amidohydrolase
MSALKSGPIDVIGSDHAPHLWSEKQSSSFALPDDGVTALKHVVAVLM